MPMTMHGMYFICSVIEALENIGDAIEVKPGEREEVAATDEYSLSVAATTPQSVPEGGFIVQASVETEVTATLPPVLFDLFDDESAVVSITVSVVTVVTLFPPKSGGTVSSAIFSLDVGVEVSDLSQPIEICIPASAVSSYHALYGSLHLNYV